MTPKDILTLFRTLNCDREAFVKAIEERGFRYLSQGCYKVSYTNDKLVVKVPQRNRDVESFKVEARAYRWASPQQRIHLLRMLAYDRRGLIVQRKVKAADCCHCDASMRASSICGVRDYPSNHFHTVRKGKRVAVFFDYGLAYKCHKNERYD